MQKFNGILAIVPARGGSKGIPGKNIKLLGGKPLIDYTFEAAAASCLLSRTVLTTDSAEIADHGRSCGMETPFLRPAELAEDNSPASDYIQHCLHFLDEKEGYRPEVVVLLQPTCPFRVGSDIDSCIEMLAKSDVDSVVSVAALPDKYHPNWQFFVTNQGLLQPAAAASFEELVTARQHLETTYTRNGAVYAFRRDAYMREGNIYGRKVAAYVMSENRSVNIDDMKDWLKAEALLDKLKL
jgi:CMP-N,N'-diacetyllegionaminic acid synthase